ncbi:hypothetical protein GK091_26050 [Spirosoma agri]|uniref:Uncharacterized protein n=1 Tax=Spirosoma agri TaxID=1987381 RepID=A0A6M0IQ00_9BACT|nr:hypothetical protein [Spirosoma agri]NEU70366.1 hypothetical protein [Spirosoma agri]
MLVKNVRQPYTPYSPPESASPPSTRIDPLSPDKDRPRKPDWLLLLIGALILLTLLIAWLVDIPTLWH